MSNSSAHDRDADLATRLEGFRRVAALLATHGHPLAPQWLDTPDRTCAEATALLRCAAVWAAA